MQFATRMLSWAAELQEAFQSGARVLGPLPLVAVRQQQHQSRFLAPLGLDPPTMNWSMIAWATLAKSPNWASHSTSESVATEEYPYSNPSTAASDSELFHTWNWACRCPRCLSGAHSRPVSESCNTRWRWLNVPRSESSPLSRTGTSSVRSAAKARASACAQSIPSSSESRRRSSCRASLGFGLKSAGHAWIAWFSSAARPRSIPVATSRRPVSTVRTP